MNGSRFFGTLIMLIVLVGIGGYYLWGRAEITGHSNIIRLEYPKSGAVINSPITITGEARGMWYFEASFPIMIVNWDGLIIGEGIAEAQDEWMTEAFVPFKATIYFDKPEINEYNKTYARRGAIILKKDNPSGDPKFDDALEVPIYFE